ncbi:MAG: hypothetical protein IK139_00045 [Lachnospiraceae bacterium]|nr:hypothetical protein [Lachnospiraceae bacterium]
MILESAQQTGMPVHGCTGKVEMSMDANGDRSRDLSERFRHFLSIIGGKKLTSKTGPASTTEYTLMP